MTICRFGVFNRRPGLSDEAFRSHWINVHGALAKKLPGLGTTARTTSSSASTKRPMRRCRQSTASRSCRSRAWHTW